MDTLIENLLAGLWKISFKNQIRSLIVLMGFALIIGALSFVSPNWAGPIEKGEFSAALLNISAFILWTAFVSGILILAKAGEDAIQWELRDIKQEFYNVAKKVLKKNLEDCTDIIHRSEKYNETYSCFGKIKNMELYLQAHKFLNNGKIIDTLPGYDNKKALLWLSVWMEDRKEMDEISNILAENGVKLHETTNRKMRMILVDGIPKLREILKTFNQIT